MWIPLISSQPGRFQSGCHKMSLQSYMLTSRLLMFCSLLFTTRYWGGGGGGSAFLSHLSEFCLRCPPPPHIKKDRTVWIENAGKDMLSIARSYQTIRLGLKTSRFDGSTVTRSIWLRKIDRIPTWHWTCSSFLSQTLVFCFSLGGWAFVMGQWHWPIRQG